MSGNWGSEFGGVIGDGYTETYSNRLLQFVRHGTNFAAFVQIFATRTENIINAIEDIRAAFDIDVAVGEQLTRLGQILQLPRFGLEDERYRILLKVQIELILSSQSTTPQLLRIVDLVTGFPPDSYAEYYPMAFEIGATVSADEVGLLISLLLKAKAAAYGMTIIASESDSVALICDYTEASQVADNETTIGYDSTDDGDDLAYEHVL